MQDLQQQSAMLQKEYEYEKELYRQQTREAGIPKRIQQGVCWFPVKLGADRYNSLNQLTVEVTRRRKRLNIALNTDVLFVFLGFRLIGRSVISTFLP